MKKSSNDNFTDEASFLLAKAHEMLTGKCESQSQGKCSLLEGGPCPLLKSFTHVAIEAIKTAAIHV